MLSKINQLIDSGLYLEAKNALSEIINQETSAEQVIIHSILKIKTNLLMRNFNEVFIDTEKLLQEKNISENSLSFIKINNIQIEALWRTNQLEKALNLGLYLFDKYNDANEKNESLKIEIGYLLYNLGRIYLFTGKLSLALDYSQRSLLKRETIDSKINIAESLNLLGIIYGYMGNSDKAINYYKESLNFREQAGNKQLMAYSLNNIGENYRLKGEIYLALEYYEKCLVLSKECNDKEGIRHALAGLGTIYINTGELNKALRYYELCTENFSGDISPFHKIEYLFLILKLKLSLKVSQEDPALVKIIQEIEEISFHYSDQTVKLFSRLSKAFILKESPRLRDIGKAQEILEEILTEEITYMENAILTMQTLVELYLVELQISKDDTLLAKINDLINKMLKIAKEQNYYPIIIKSSILQARMALLDDKFDQATRILDQAHNLAEQNNLNGLINLIEDEQQKMIKKIKKWQNLIDANSSMYERIQQSKLLNYIKDIEKLIEKEE